MAWTGGEFGGEWAHVYVWLDPFAVHLTLSQHCLLIGYTPQYKIKSKKRKKKQEQYCNKSYKDSKNGSHQKKSLKHY